MTTRTTNAPPPRRRSVSLTIREDVIAAAKELELNLSRAAERGIQAAVKAAREEQWLRENRDAIAAHNERLAEDGPLLTPDWAKR